MFPYLQYTGGITADMLPKVMGGNLDFDVNEWIDNRRRLGL
jgi:hypothetical protein